MFVLLSISYFKALIPVGISFKMRLSNKLLRLNEVNWLGSNPVELVALEVETSEGPLSLSPHRHRGKVK